MLATVERGYAVRGDIYLRQYAAAVVEHFRFIGRIRGKRPDYLSGITLGSEQEFGRRPTLASSI